MAPLPTRPERPRFLGPFLLLSTFAAAPLGAQGGGWDVGLEFSGQVSGSQLGASLAPAGDLDGDGVPDLLVGAPGAPSGPLANAGLVLAFSGADGATLRTFAGTAFGQGFGTALDGGADLDGDGVPDLVVGMPADDPAGVPDAGAAEARSGADGSVLWRVTGTETLQKLGTAVAFVGDVDGDGVADVLVGAPRSDVAAGADGGSAFLHSGANGSLIRRFDGSAAGARLGTSLVGLDDLDGDGVDDLALGAPGADGDRGRVLVVSGASGSQLLALDGLSRGDLFGEAMLAASDLDGDGVGDLVVGAPHADPGGLYLAGMAAAHSGVTGTRLFLVAGAAPNDLLGSALAELGDLDGDGVHELALGAPGADTSTGAVHVVTGANGTTLWTLTGGATFDTFGDALAALPDVLANGRDELVAGAPFADPNGAGSAGLTQVLDFSDFLVADRDTVSAAAANPVVLDLDFPVAAGGDLYQVLYSLTPGVTSVLGLEVPLGADSWFWASFSGDYGGVANPWNLTGVLDAFGDAQGGFEVGPYPPSIVGHSAFLAAIAYPTVFGSGPGWSSTAWTITVTP